MTHFGWNFWSNGVFRRNPSHKNVSKKLARKPERNFLNFLEYCLKATTEKSEICIFLNVFKCKVTFFKLIGSIAVFLIRGCLHWLSSSLRSRIMADHNFKRQDCGFCGRWGNCYRHIPRCLSKNSQAYSSFAFFISYFIPMKQAIIKCCIYVIRNDPKILELSTQVEWTHIACRFRRWSNTFCLRIRLSVVEYLRHGSYRSWMLLT